MSCFKSIAQKIEEQNDLYAKLSAEYKKLEAADPLNHDYSNVAVLTSLMGYRSEVLCHKSSLEELGRAYDEIERLESKLRALEG